MNGLDIDRLKADLGILKQNFANLRDALSSDKCAAAMRDYPVQCLHGSQCVHLCIPMCLSLARHQLAAVQSEYLSIRRVSSPTYGLRPSQ